MDPRYRSRSIAGEPGRYGVPAYMSDWTYRSVTNVTETCDDVIGNYGEVNPFSLDRIERYPYRVSTTTTRRDRIQYHNCPPDNHLAAVQSISMDMPNINHDMFVKLAASTNPSSPSIQLPVALFELKDIPSMVRKFGRDAFANAGDGYLRYQFGLKPLLADVRRLLSFVQSVEKRVREFERMRDKGGIRKGVTFAEKSDLLTIASRVAFTGAGTVRESVVTVRTQKIWGSIWWYPTPFLKSRTRDEMRRLAKSITLGLHRSQFGLNAWNAIPWSWLIDWFKSLSDALAAGNHTVARPKRACIMHSDVTSETRTPIYSGSGLVIQGTGRYRIVRKRRYYDVPFMPASVPALTGRQLSILGALSAVKTRR